VRRFAVAAIRIRIYRGLGIHSPPKKSVLSDGIISRTRVGFFPLRSGFFPFPTGNFSLVPFCNTSKDKDLEKRVSL